MDESLDSLTHEELAEFIRVNKSKQASLQSDITLLKKQISHFGLDLISDERFQVVIRPDGTDNSEEVQASLEKHTEELTERLKKTIDLTDITIHKVERKVTELDEHLCKTDFSVDMTIFDRDVHLTYLVEDPLVVDKEGESDSSRILWFQLTFDEEINNAIGQEIVRAAERTAIQSVFSLLKTFLQWQQSRDEMVQHFVDTYPDNVSVDLEQDGLLLMNIALREPHHPVFVIEWDRKTTESRIEADLRLKVTAPQQMLAQDKKQLLERAPEMFQHMLSVHGQEKAIDNLVSLLIGGPA